MLLRIDAHAATPIFEQIVAQIVFAVARGDLTPGELIPSVRELAQELLVNPNTVARAYGELERQSVLVTRRGRGMEVTLDARRACQRAREEQIRQRFRADLRDAAGSGLPAARVRKLLADELRRAYGNHAPQADSTKKT